MSLAGDFSRLVDELEHAAEERSADAVVRAAEASAVKSSLAALREQARAQRAQARSELAAMGRQRRDSRRQARSDARAVLDDIRNDVDLLLGQIRGEQLANRQALARIAEDRQQRLEEVRYRIAVGAAARRKRIAAMLDRFAERRQLEGAELHDRLSGYTRRLRHAVGEALVEYRQQRAALRQAWRRRRLTHSRSIGAENRPPSVTMAPPVPTLADLVAIPAAMPVSALRSTVDAKARADAAKGDAGQSVADWLADAAVMAPPGPARSTDGAQPSR